MCIPDTRKIHSLRGNHPDYWKDEKAFYLDEVSFLYKTNLVSMTMSSKVKVWRKKGEELTVTAKGAKDLASGKRLHLYRYDCIWQRGGFKGDI